MKSHVKGFHKAVGLKLCLIILRPVIKDQVMAMGR